MPVFNAEQFLDKAIRSLVRQSVRDWHLIAVNDGSTDGSSRILDEWAAQDARVMAFHRDHEGLGASLQFAASNATGPFLARMDADDLSAPTRLAKQLNLLVSQPTMALCGTWAWAFNDALGIFAACRLPNDDSSLRNRLIKKGSSTFVHGSVMFRADHYRSVTGYRFPRFGEDHDLWLQLAEVGELGIVEEYLYAYRVNLGSTSFVEAAKGRAVRKLAVALHQERSALGSERTDYNSACSKIDASYPSSSATMQWRLASYMEGIRRAERGESRKARELFWNAVSFDSLGFKAMLRAVGLIFGLVRESPDSLASVSQTEFSEKTTWVRQLLEM